MIFLTQKSTTEKRVIIIYQEKEQKIRHENRTFLTRQNSRPENTPENTPENS